MGGADLPDRDRADPPDQPGSLPLTAALACLAAATLTLMVVSLGTGWMLWWQLRASARERADLLDRLGEMVGHLHTYQVLGVGSGAVMGAGPPPDPGEFDDTPDESEIVMRLEDALREAEFEGTELVRVDGGE